MTNLIEPLEFFLHGPEFSYRKKNPNTKKMETKHGQHPIPKSNAKSAVQRPGSKFPVVIEDPRTKAASKALISALEPLGPRYPFGAVRLDVDFVFVPLKSPKWRHEAALAGFIECDQHNYGDRDNLHKMLADAMQAAGFFADDCQVTRGEVAKVYGPHRGFRIKLTPLRSVASFEEWKDTKRRIESVKERIRDAR